MGDRREGDFDDFYRTSRRRMLVYVCRRSGTCRA